MITKKQRLAAIILIVCIWLSQINLVQAATQTVQEMDLTYTASATPGSLVSFLVTTADADYSNLQASQIVKSEIIKADTNGVAVFTVKLTNVQLDDDGKILNYKLNSNIKTLTIDSGKEKTWNTLSVSLHVDGNGVVFVPIQQTYQELGVSLTYDSSAKSYTGKWNNGEFEIIMGKDSVEIDWVDVAMPAASKTVDGVDMVPIYILEDTLKIAPPRVDLDTMQASVEELADYSYKDELDIGAVVSGLTGTTIIDGLNSDVAVNPGTGTLSRTYASGGVLQIDARANSYGEISTGYVYRGTSSNTYTKGDVALISFQGRATYTESDDNVAAPTIMYERTDWQKILETPVTFSMNQWQQYYIPVYSTTWDTSDSAAKLMFRIVEPMSIEIKDFKFVNYGTQISIDTIQPEATGYYKGIESDALWRKEAYRRIDRYRKDDMTVTVKDKSGSPVSNAKIDVNMTENEFMFGVAITKPEMLDLDSSTPRGQIMPELLENSFNTGVCGLEMKTPDMVEDEGADAIEMANEFFSQGKRMRGHALYWDGNSLQHYPDYEQNNYQTMYDNIMDDLRPAAYAFRGKLAQWDVLNEPVSSRYMRTTFNSTRLQADIFKEARKIDPDVKLYVNETGIEGRANEYMGDRIPEVVKIIKSLKREGAPVDGIGIQAHCTNFYYPQGFYHQIDECAEVVDEISITEYDFLQADHQYADEHLRDTLLVTFSHPKTKAFVVWGVQDTMHWRNAAPFYDKDWNERPAKAVWDNMVNNEFKTKETLYTDAQGRVTLRGFTGNYEITCTANGTAATTEFTLTKGGANTVNFTVSDTEISGVASQTPEKIEPMTYRSTGEAIREYYETTDPEYRTVYMDANFKGAETDSAVMDGSTTSTDAFLKGRAWKCETGMNGLVVGGDDISLIVKPTQAKAGALRHKILVEKQYDGTDYYLETMFDTLGATDTNKVVNEMIVYGTYRHSLGTIVYENGSYYIDTVDGHRISLDKNTQYNLRVIELADGTGLVYQLMKGDTVVTAYKAEGKKIGETVNEVAYLITASTAGDQAVYKLHNTRFAAEKLGEIMLFSPTDYQQRLLDEDMYYFDLDAPKYLGSKVTSALLKTVDSNNPTWYLYGGKNSTAGFSFQPNGMFLSASRNTPMGENTLIKRFEPIVDGETLELSFNMYLNVPTVWYTSASSGKLSIGSADKSVVLDIVNMKNSPYNGNYLAMMERQDPYVDNPSSYTTMQKIPYNGTINQTDLNVKLTLEPNSSGTYDGTLRIWSIEAEEYNQVHTGIFTADEVKKLEAIHISSKTDAASDTLGDTIIGFKNIKLTRTGKNLEGIYDNRSDIAIQYENVTKKPQQATALVAAYKDDFMVGVQMFDCVLDAGEGEIALDMSELTTSDAEYYKVFLLQNMENLIPYKASDVLLIQ